MSGPHFAPDDFLPVTSKATETDERNQETAGFWRQALERFCRNRKSLAAFVVILLLLLFSFAGPLFWQVDPASQDLSRISQPPGTSRNSLLIPELTPWLFTEKPSAPLQAPEWKQASLAFDGTPHTETVRFSWPERQGTELYRVYRHILPPSGPLDLGLPLAEVLTDGDLHFEDRLSLRARSYFYSIAAMENGYIVDVITTQTEVVQAITLSDAQQRGLIEPVDTAFIPAENQLLELPFHPLGTDYLGRDMLARLMAGGRTSLFIGITAPLAFVFIGLLYGSISGYASSRIDNILMSFADFVIALPFLLFMILFKVVFGVGPGENGVLTMLFAMVILSWPTTARLVRGQVLLLRAMPYIESAKMMGASPAYLIARHMLPNLLGIAMVTLSFAIPVAIFTEAFLSFIGMGVVPPTPSWGSMCNDGIKTLFTYPHELLFPALLISLTVLCFNLLGDGLRDALDIREST